MTGPPVPKLPRAACFSSNYEGREGGYGAPWLSLKSLPSLLRGWSCVDSLFIFSMQASQGREKNKKKINNDAWDLNKTGETKKSKAAAVAERWGRQREVGEWRQDRITGCSLFSNHGSGERGGEWSGGTGEKETQREDRVNNGGGWRARRGRRRSDWK